MYMINGSGSDSKLIGVISCNLLVGRKQVPVQSIITKKSDSLISESPVEPAHQHSLDRVGTAHIHKV